jgi:hypothetical protein
MKEIKQKHNQKKEYHKPDIIHELTLETKAGSPLGDPIIDPLKTPSDG